MTWAATWRNYNHQSERLVLCRAGPDVDAMYTTSLGERSAAGAVIQKRAFDASIRLQSIAGADPVVCSEFRDVALWGFGMRIT